jgi:hypothetical protein
MKKFVYLFGALLIFSASQNVFAGDNDGTITYDFSGGDHNDKNKDHKRINYGPFNVGVDFNYLRSTSTYDADGNKQENYGGDIYTRFNEIIRARYNGGKVNIGNSKWHWGVEGDFSFIQSKWKPGDMNTYGVGQSYDGFTFTPSIDIGTRRLGGSRLGTRIAIKYQIDGTKNESNATDRQNALGASLNFNYKLLHSTKIFVGMDYWNAFKGTEKLQVYNYQTFQYEYMNVDYNQGNQLAIYGGGDYKWCWGDCGWGYAGLKLNYWNRAEQSFNGKTIDKSGSNYLSLTPKAGFRWKSFPLNVSLSAAYKNEYGIEQGMIGLSGKNILKPSLALQLNMSYRIK